MLNVHMKKKTHRNQENFLEMTHMFSSSLVVVRLSQVYANVQNCQDLYIKCVHFLVCINNISIKL